MNVSDLMYMIIFVCATEFISIVMYVDVWSYVFVYVFLCVSDFVSMVL